MKINPILFIFAVALAVVLSYTIYVIADPEDPQIKSLVISSAVSIGIVLVSGFGCGFDHAGKNTNLRIVSFLFLFMLVAEHLAFAYWGAKQNGLIIISGFIVIIYLLSIYSLSKLK